MTVATDEKTGPARPSWSWRWKSRRLQTIPVIRNALEASRRRRRARRIDIGTEPGALAARAQLHEFHTPGPDCSSAAELTRVVAGEKVDETWERPTGFVVCRQRGMTRSCVSEGREHGMGHDDDFLCSLARLTP